MRDVVAWSKLNRLRKALTNFKSAWDTWKEPWTAPRANKLDNLDASVSTRAQESSVLTVKRVVEDSANTVTQTSNSLKQSMSGLVTDVTQTVQTAPTGVPAPQMAMFNASSVKNGIKIDYKVNVGVGQNGQVPNGDYDYPLVSVTKGVMVRYSSTHFPTNRNDGTLAFVDEDVLSTQENGQLTAKVKTRTITSGMALDNDYYFTAFPYSNYGVYNEQLGVNCKKVQYLGEVGTLKVSVSSDVLVKPLSYTLTLSGGGKTYTKKGSGSAEFVFIVPPDSYTLSASSVDGYYTPSSQPVSISTAVIKTTSVQYRNSVSLASATWSDINTIAKAGKAKVAFSLGDTKDIIINGETITLEIVDFDHDDLESGGKAPITFGMKELMALKRSMNSSDTNKGGFTGSEMYSWLNGTMYNSLPSDLRAVIKPVYKKTNAGGVSSTINTEVMKIWLFSLKEAGVSALNGSSEEGYTYPTFTSISNRIKRLSNGSGAQYSWWLRSPNKAYVTYFCNISDGGNDESSGYASKLKGVCWGFCI